ncbi:MAG: lysophospholipase [Burkholderiaceae bacterium]|nr:lysophospholipase [Burkholderiaceae bacterium]
MMATALPTLQRMKTLSTEDGLQLHLRQWAPVSATKGCVLLVHGLGEHVGRYDHVARYLNSQGWLVLAHDQRGHGASGGARGDIPHPLQLVEDLGRVIQLVRSDVQLAARPLVLLGHSMGGLVAARYVAEGVGANVGQAMPNWFQAVDGLVLSSPALDPGMNPLQKLALALLGPIAPHLAVGNGLKPAWISRDPAVVAAYVADPLVHNRVTPTLVRMMADQGEEVLELCPTWRVPTLLMWAGADRCVAPQGSAAFAAALPQTLLQARCFDGLYHEIFNEPEQAQVLAQLGDWLSTRWP